MHVLFWTVIYFFFVYLKIGMLGLPYGQTMLVTIKDLVIIGLIFYFLAYYATPKLLLKRKTILFLLSLLLIYYFYALSVYLEFLLVPKVIHIPGQGYQNYLKRVLPEGISGVFLFRNSAEILLDLSYLLSPALIAKLFVELVQSSTKMMKLEMDNLNLELAFLKSQINPHFLFNNLNNIYSLALHRNDGAADAVLKLSDLMRYTLYDSNINKISLEKEIQFFRNYIELEKMRHSARVFIDFKITGSSGSLSIAPLIIFPFIENAFKHGIDATLEHSSVNIQITVTGSTLSFAIQNSKPAVTRKTSATVGGIGITNTTKRLKLLYQDKHKLEIQELDRTFSVYLEMRLD